MAETISAQPTARVFISATLCHEGIFAYLMTISALITGHFKELSAESYRGCGHIVPSSWTGYLIFQLPSLIRYQVAANVRTTS